MYCCRRLYPYRFIRRPLYHHHLHNNISIKKYYHHGITNHTIQWEQPSKEQQQKRRIITRLAHIGIAVLSPPLLLKLSRYIILYTATFMIPFETITSTLPKLIMSGAGKNIGLLMVIPTTILSSRLIFGKLERRHPQSKVYLSYFGGFQCVPRQPEIMAIWVIVLAFVLFIAVQVMVHRIKDMSSHCISVAHPQADPNIYISFMINHSLFEPILQETVFRGLVFGRLLLVTNVPLAYILTVGAYMYAKHYSDVTIPMGLVLCVLYHATGQLWIPILYHTVWNASHSIANYYNTPLYSVLKRREYLDIVAPPLKSLPKPTQDTIIDIITAGEKMFGVSACLKRRRQFYENRYEGKRNSKLSDKTNQFFNEISNDCNYVALDDVIRKCLDLHAKGAVPGAVITISKSHHLHHHRRLSESVVQNIGDAYHEDYGVYLRDIWQGVNGFTREEFAKFAFVHKHMLLLYGFELKLKEE